MLAVWRPGGFTAVLEPSSPLPRTIYFLHCFYLFLKSSSLWDLISAQAIGKWDLLAGSPEPEEEAKLENSDTGQQKTWPALAKPLAGQLCCNEVS